MRRRDFIAGLAGVAAWPAVVRAQQSALPVIGYLSSNAYVAAAESIDAAFRRGIGEKGFVEGRNVQILYKYPEISFRGLPELAADFVRRRVAVIFAFSTPASLAAKKAAADIPIVFAVGTDPVQAGLVAILNRPGGNVTGITDLIVDMTAKRLELLHEIAAATSTIGYLNNPSVSAVGDPSIAPLKTAARTLGVRLVTANASTPSEIELAFAKLVAEGAGALLVGIFFFEQRDQVIALAARYALPAIYAYREMVVAGGLMSYAGNVRESVRLAGAYVGRVLKGEKPADLPVQRSTKFELALNLKTAKALGITFPTSLLVRADEVIE